MHSENDIDLMEQVRSQDYNEKKYFELCKEQALNYIKKAEFIFENTNFNEVKRKFLKYFNIDIEDERLKEYFDLNDLPKWDNNRFYPRVFISCCTILSNRKKAIDFSFIIDDNNFDTTLCKFLYVMEIFFNKHLPVAVNELKKMLEDYYDISLSHRGDEIFKVYVLPKYNIELIEATEKLAEKEPSLKEVLNDMYSLKYVEALQKLAKLLKNHKYEYKNLIQNTDNSLFDIEKFLNFVNNYNIRHGDEDTQKGDIKKQKQPTDEQLKVHLDFGLSIYRLFSIYQSENEK